MSETKGQYAANYRKPPLHTRFKKGRSGNRRGRPKKSTSADSRATKMLMDIGCRRANGRPASQNP